MRTHANEAEKQQDFRVGADDRPRTPHARQRKGRKQDQREQPPVEGHRQRRHFRRERAPHDPVAGPEKGRQRQQHVG
jgi:hypothetical protein